MAETKKVDIEPPDIRPKGLGSFINTFVAAEDNHKTTNWNDQTENGEQKEKETKQDDETDEYKDDADERSNDEEEKTWLYCDDCGKSLQSTVSMEMHKMYSCNKKKKHKFKCKVCGKKLRSKETVKLHMKTMHSEDTDKPASFQCNLCEKSYKVKHRLTHHVHIVHAQKLYNCDNCDKGFPTEKLMEKHMEKVHKDREKVSCPKCAQLFATPHSMQRHLTTQHRRCKCLLCGQRFFTLENGYEHMSAVHVGRTPPFSCRICAHFQGDDRCEFEKHMHTHIADMSDSFPIRNYMNQKPLKCLLCGRRVDWQTSEKHIRESHIPDSAPFKCLICQYSDNATLYLFDDVESLVKHLTSHVALVEHTVPLGEPAKASSSTPDTSATLPYKCLLCHKRLPDIKAGIAHMKSEHLPDLTSSLYCCTICQYTDLKHPGKYEYTDPDTFVQHLLVHLVKTKSTASQPGPIVKEESGLSDEQGASTALSHLHKPPAVQAPKPPTKAVKARGGVKTKALMKSKLLAKTEAKRKASAAKQWQQSVESEAGEAASKSAADSNKVAQPSKTKPRARKVKYVLHVRESPRQRLVGLQRSKQKQASPKAKEVSTEGNGAPPKDPFEFTDTEFDFAQEPILSVVDEDEIEDDIPLAVLAKQNYTKVVTTKEENSSQAVRQTKVNSSEVSETVAAKNMLGIKGKVSKKTGKISAKKRAETKISENEKEKVKNSKITAKSNNNLPQHIKKRNFQKEKQVHKNNEDSVGVSQTNIQKQRTENKMELSEALPIKRRKTRQSKRQEKEAEDVKVKTEGHSAKVKPQGQPLKKTVLSSQDMLNILEDVKNETKVRKLKRKMRRLKSEEVLNTEECSEALDTGHRKRLKRTAKQETVGGGKLAQEQLEQSVNKTEEKDTIDQIIDQVAKGQIEGIDGGKTKTSKAANLKLKIKLKGKTQVITSNKRQAIVKKAAVQKLAKGKLRSAKMNNEKAGKPAKRGRPAKNTNGTVKKVPLKKTKHLTESRGAEKATDKFTEEFLPQPGENNAESTTLPVETKRNPKIKTTDEVRKQLKEGKQKGGSAASALNDDYKDSKLKLSVSPKRDDRLAKLIASVAKSLHVEVEIEGDEKGENSKPKQKTSSCASTLPKDDEKTEKPPSVEEKQATSTAANSNSTTTAKSNSATMAAKTNSATTAAKSNSATAAKRNSATTTAKSNSATTGIEESTEPKVNDPSNGSKHPGDSKMAAARSSECAVAPSSETPAVNGSPDARELRDGNQADAIHVKKELCLNGNEAPVDLPESEEMEAQLSARDVKDEKFRYRCGVCGRRYMQELSYQRHLLCHSGEHPYTCNVCDASYSCPGTLEKHKRTHTGEKPYKCTICGRGFTQSTNRNRHMMTHTGLKPWKCPTCGKGFQQKIHVEAHLSSVHSATSQYMCTVCKREFTRPDALKRHLRIHTGERPFGCSYCPKTFGRKECLKTHIASYHRKAEANDSVEGVGTASSDAATTEDTSSTTAVTMATTATTTPPAQLVHLDDPPTPVVCS